MTPSRSWLVEALGMLLAPALLFRDFSHVLIAGIGDLNPALADGSDVTLASPVASLRGHRFDTTARFTSVLIAMLFAFGFHHVAWVGVPGTWLTINWLVLVADPAFGMMHRIRNQQFTLREAAT